MNVWEYCFSTNVSFSLTLGLLLPRMRLWFAGLLGLCQPNKWKFEFDPSNMPPVTIEDYLERKQQAQSGGKCATLRSWKTYYTVLSGQSATLEPVYANLLLASGDPESDTMSELDSKEKRSSGQLSKFLSRKHKPANWEHFWNSNKTFSPEYFYDYLDSWKPIICLSGQQNITSLRVFFKIIL